LNILTFIVFIKWVVTEVTTVFLTKQNESKCLVQDRYIFLE